MKKIMIIGAGFLQTYVIKRAKELGYYVISVDANPNAEGFKYADEYSVINIVDKEKCLEYAKKMKIDGVLTAATDYGVLTTAYIAEKLDLRGTSFESAKIVKNKYSVRARLSENGVSDIGQFFEISSIDELNKIENEIVYPVIIKPCDASGSRGVHRIDDGGKLKDSVLDAMKNSLTGKALIETFVEGEEYGVESYVLDGNVYVLAVMKKRMTKAPYYAELGHSLPSGLPEKIVRRFEEKATEIIKAIGINNSSVNMDFILSKDNIPYMVDIGARMGGNLIGSHIVPYSTGVDYMGNMIKSAVGDATSFETFAERKYVCTRVLALTEGKIIHLPDFDEIKRKFDVLIEHHMKPGDAINKYRTNLDGCGYIVSVSHDILTAEKNATMAYEELDMSIVRE